MNLRKEKFLRNFINGCKKVMMEVYLQDRK